MMPQFNNGILQTSDISLNAFLMFSPTNVEYETYLKFLNSLPDRPYKSKKKRAFYAAEILMKMNDNGIKITSNV